MIGFFKTFLSRTRGLADKAKGIVIYDKALALHSAKDYKSAQPLMIEAAKLGNLNAMTLLGSMYLLGQGVKEDGKTAVHWLQKAIDGNYEGAISVLGMAYATGKAGVKIDLPKARELLTHAAGIGDKQSARMLEMMDKGEGLFAKLGTRKSNKPHPRYH